jgi:hypothetical protein
LGCEGEGGKKRRRTKVNSEGGKNKTREGTGEKTRDKRNKKRERKRRERERDASRHTQPELFMPTLVPKKGNNKQRHILNPE